MEFHKETKHRGFKFVTGYVLREVVMGRIRRRESIEIVQKYNPDRLDYYRANVNNLLISPVLGVHHIITVDGVGTFALHRGQIHTVSFIATNPGTINFFCSVHLPNMVGQILVLPKSI